MAGPALKPPVLDHTRISFVFCAFNCEVDFHGPQESTAQSTWLQAMAAVRRHGDLVKNLFWATATNDPHHLTIVDARWPYVPEEGYGPERDIGTLEALLLPLHRHLSEPPRLVHAMPVKGSHFGEWQDGYNMTVPPREGFSTAIDLLLVKARTVPMIASLPDGPDWLSGLPLLQYPRWRGSRMVVIPGSSGRHGNGHHRPPPKEELEADLQRFMAARTLTTFYHVPQPEEVVEEVLIVEWVSVDGRTRFQDPTQPSIVCGARKPVADDAWHTEFLEPLDTLRQEESVESLESWTLEMHEWPLPSQEKAVTARKRGSCVDRLRSLLAGTRTRQSHPRDQAETVPGIDPTKTPIKPEASSCE